MVPCVMTGAQHSSVYHYDLTTGLPAKLVPLVEALAITEIEALAILCEVRAYMVGAGGIAGSEGSVHLAIEGDEDKVKKAFELILSLKDEPPVGMPDVTAVADPAECDYDAQTQLDTLGGK